MTREKFAKPLETTSFQISQAKQSVCSRSTWRCQRTRLAAKPSALSRRPEQEFSHAVAPWTDPHQRM